MIRRWTIYLMSFQVTMHVKVFKLIIGSWDGLDELIQFNKKWYRLIKIKVKAPYWKEIIIKKVKLNFKQVAT